MTSERPNNCRNALRDAGKPYPKSGCAVCKDGGLMGCPYEKPRDDKPVTSERSELEALANCCGVVLRDPHGRKTWEFDGPGLHELTRRLQPARVPDWWPREWRSALRVAFDTLETEAVMRVEGGHDADARQMRRAGNMICKMLAAAPAAEGGMAEPVAWMRDSPYVCDNLTNDKTVADMWRERGWKVAPLGVIDNPAPESREAPKCERCGARNADEAATMCKPMGDDCPGVALFDKPEAGQREGSLKKQQAKALQRCEEELQSIIAEAEDLNLDECSVAALQTGIESIKLRRLASAQQAGMAHTLERMSQDYDTTGRVVEAASLRMAAMLVRREQQRTGSRGEGEG